MAFKRMYNKKERSSRSKVLGIINGTTISKNVFLSLSPEVLNLVSPNKTTCGILVGYGDDIGKIYITAGSDLRITMNAGRGLISIRGVLKDIARMLKDEEDVFVYIEPQGIIEGDRVYFDFFSMYSNNSSTRKFQIKGKKGE